MPTTYLSAATTAETVQALDQNGFPYVGADLANTTVVSSVPGNVGASLSAFDLTTGLATLTLTQGAPGTSVVTISNGAVSLDLNVESYVPVLASFAIVPPAPVVVAPAPVVDPAPVVTAPVVPTPEPAPVVDPVVVEPAPTPAVDPSPTVDPAPVVTPGS